MKILRGVKKIEKLHKQKQQTTRQVRAWLVDWL